MVVLVVDSACTYVLCACVLACARLCGVLARLCACDVAVVAWAIAASMCVVFEPVCICLVANMNV